MTITNKPNDGEPVVQRVVDPVFGEKYIFTPVMWRFIDELTDTSNKSESEASETDALLFSNVARLTQLEEEVADNPFTVDSSGWSADTSQVTADMGKA